MPWRLAFELRTEDVPSRASAVTVARDGTRTVVVNARTGRRAEIDADVEAVTRVLEAIDGVSAAGSLVAAAQPLVGTAILLTDVIDRLESRLSRAQLLRFPQQSPYAMTRTYWENAIAVRARLDRLYAAAHDPDASAAALRGLHRLATVGESGRNYYGAAGHMVTSPGDFRGEHMRTHLDATILRAIQDWAGQLGVRHRLLLDGVIEIDGVVAVERRRGGLACAHRMGVDGSAIRALVDRARRALIEALDAIRRGDRAAVMAACAAWHRAFVMAHPFGNVNNSIAMNVVNDLLEKSGACAIPHLFLDHLALRLSEADYEAAFARVVAGAALECTRGSTAGDAALSLVHLTLRADRAERASRRAAGE